MVRGVIWVVRQRRYRAFLIGSLVFAVACVVAGTWQIYRFQESVHGNRTLRANAEAPAVALSPALVPVTGPAAGRLAVEYRTVRVIGKYDPAADTTFLTRQFHNSTAGFAVITPLHTSTGTLLVDRGYLPATANGLPKTPPDAPTRTVTLVGRLAPATSTPVKRSSNGLVTALSVGAPATYRAYLTLDKGQPGGHGLIAAPSPNLSNPYGGAYEWQHLAYIVQWYVFGLLALLAPFFLARSEVRDARRRWLGIDAGEQDVDELAAVDEPADRPALVAAGDDGALLPARRGQTALQQVERVSPQQLQWARRMAARYGRSLGPDEDIPLLASRRARRRDLTPRAPVTDSRRALHRSDDTYHGSYNDYLWQLAMADGNVPDVQIDTRSDDERDPGS